MKKSRKAISPIVATVLLVLIAAVAGALIWYWMSGFASTNPIQQRQLYEQIKIDAVSYDSVNDNVTIYVRNTGSVSSVISAAYLVDTATGSMVCSNTTIPESYGTLQVGDSKVIPIENCVLNAGVYNIKVVTKSGVEATYTFVYGGS